MNLSFFFKLKKMLSLLKFRKPNSKSSFQLKKEPEWTFYTLSRFHLENLIEKQIPFLFFQLEDFSLLRCDYKTKSLLEKARIVKLDKLDIELKNQAFTQAIVLICEKGSLSLRAFETLRSQGFINVYFMEGGLEALLKEE